MQLDDVKRLLSGGKTREEFRSAFFGRVQKKSPVLGRQQAEPFRRGHDRAVTAVAFAASTCESTGSNSKISRAACWNSLTENDFSE